MHKTGSKHHPLFRSQQEHAWLLENLVENSAVATFAVNAEHRVVLWNKACERLTGISAHEVIGTDNHWKPFYALKRQTLSDVIIDGDGEKLSSLYARHAKSALIPNGLQAEGWYRNLNGRDRYIVFDAVPLLNDRNELVAVIETLTDITERKIAEELLAKKTVELERSNAELVQFSSVVSHDLKAPLVTIGGFAEVLHTKYESKLDDRGRKFLQHIYDGTIRMERMISDLLTYAQVSTRGKPFELVVCDSIFTQALANLSAAVEESGAGITSDELPVVLGDETQLIQLFQNLIGNAVKYRGDKPPRIHVSAGPLLESAVRNDGAHAQSGFTDQASEKKPAWLFAVADNGIGFDQRHAERIFEIFHRLPTGDKYSGTGIGLAICRKIVERHGGRIWADSEPGKGSVFSFTIPEQCG